MGGELTASRLTCGHRRALARECLVARGRDVFYANRSRRFGVAHGLPGPCQPARMDQILFAGARFPGRLNTQSGCDERSNRIVCIQAEGKVRRLAWRPCGVETGG